MLCAVFLLAWWQLASAALLGTVSSTTISGSAVVNIPAAITYPMSDLIDNFDSASTVNNLGGSYNPLNTAADRLVNIAKDTNNYSGASGKSLRVNYLTVNTTDWVGMQITLAPSGGARDISTYKSLNFDIKGEDLGQSFKIELLNANSVKASIYLSDYADLGTSTGTTPSTGWTHVVIPLDAFANFTDASALTNLTYINFVFENGYEDKCGLLKSSTIYIDNLVFGTTQQNVVRIDHFGDNYGPDALGGNSGPMSGASDPLDTPIYAQISYDTTTFHNFPRSLKYYYNVPTGMWSGYWIQFGGGVTGSTATVHDFSGYSKLRLTVRGADSLTPPTKFKIELGDSYQNRVVYLPDSSTTPLTPISSTSWNTYEIDLANFSGLAIEAIKQMNIVFEDWSVGAQTGTVYIDEIEFVR